MPSKLSERLKETRELRGFKNQTLLADEVKRLFPESQLTQQTISLIESGKQESTGYIAELAIALKVNTDWLALEFGPRDRGDDGYVITDKKLVTAVKIMEPMADYQRDQAIKILDTLAQPADRQAEGG